MHISAHYPGYLFCQDTFYIDTIKGLGRIYQQTGIDAYSNFGFAKVYTDKTAISAIGLPGNESIARLWTMPYTLR